MMVVLPTFTQETFGLSPKPFGGNTIEVNRHWFAKHRPIYDSFRNKEKNDPHYHADPQANIFGIVLKLVETPGSDHETENRQSEFHRGFHDSLLGKKVEKD